MTHTARQTLRKARYFFSKAREAEVNSSILQDRLPFSANLEAAIVYARASIEHLKTEFAPKYNARGYSAWHDAAWQKYDASEAVFKHFYNRQNFIFQQEPEKTFSFVLRASAGGGLNGFLFEAINLNRL